MRLVVADLAMRYGRRVLFRHLSFEVAAGEVVAITGANGAGKTTLVKILAGVLLPDAGTVSLDVHGVSIAAKDRPLQVGLVGPYLGLYDDLTVREMLLFLAKGRSLPQPAERVQTVLERVHLTARADDRVGTFSSGLKQRARLATALLADPPLLLLDEPTTTLDAAGRALVADVVSTQRAAGKLLLLATNDPAERALCDREVAV